MSFTDAVYLAAIIEGVDELVKELEREQSTRRQHEQTIQQLQQMIGQLQVR
jgi:predicted RNA-binding protein associated with RNAse of E/G family